MHRAKGRVAVALLATVFTLGAGAVWGAGDEEVHVARQKWTFGGFFGKFDNSQLQRGFRVYSEVCARCHGLKRIAFRNLAEPGGPHFPEAGVKSLAANYEVDDAPNDQGKVLKRPATLADYLPSPYKNEQEARYAQNGALPPDLSLIVRARAVETNAPFYRVPDRMISDMISGYQDSGADYVYAFLTGFADPPKGMKMGDFMNYNKVFAGHQTAMPNPFVAGDGVVKYDDGTPATVDHYARDVTSFLAWAADPRLEERKRLGMMVFIYLLITAVLLGFAKRRVWRDLH